MILDDMMANSLTNGLFLCLCFCNYVSVIGNSSFWRGFSGGVDA